MYGGNGRMLIVILCAGFVLPSLLLGQQELADPKGVTPEQEAYRQYRAKYRSLQAQAKQVFDAEIAREKAGECLAVKTDYDFNVCYGKELTITNQNLKSYESFILELMAPPPQMPGQPEVQTSPPANGIAGPAFTSREFEQEFERVEQSWTHYREVACTAAFHQLEGGTGGPSFELECELKLARGHMRELNMIYGEELHQ